MFDMGDAVDVCREGGMGDDDLSGKVVEFVDRSPCGDVATGIRDISKKSWLIGRAFQS
jgi:hypothetical protein